jgi:hypothetical protein
VQDSARAPRDAVRMSIDLDAATRFMATHARMVDRRRFDLLLGGAEANRPAALAAVDAYRNPDGGYGHGLEPDLRAPESQPGGALHAFEVFRDVAPVTSPRAAQLCDWLAAASLPDGGLPFALPIADPAGCAPFWAGADPEASSLQITAVVTATAHDVARHDPAVAAHPWLAQATDYCLGASAVLAEATAPHALELTFACWLLDAVHATRPEAADLVERLGRHVPADGLLHVAGGLEDEHMRPLDLAPGPGTPVRALFDGAIVDAELERLAAQQQADGGWPCDFQNYSPAAVLEWRGHLTVKALQTLRRNGVLGG